MGAAISMFWVTSVATNQSLWSLVEATSPGVTLTLVAGLAVGALGFVVFLVRGVLARGQCSMHLISFLCLSPPDALSSTLLAQLVKQLSPQHRNEQSAHNQAPARASRPHSPLCKQHHAQPHNQPVRWQVTPTALLTLFPPPLYPRPLPSVQLPETTDASLSPAIHAAATEDLDAESPTIHSAV